MGSPFTFSRLPGFVRYSTHMRYELFFFSWLFLEELEFFLRHPLQVSILNTQSFGRPPPYKSKLKVTARARRKGWNLSYNGSAGQESL